MNEEKKTFEAPLLTTLSVETINSIGTSAKSWNTNSYGIPDLNDLDDQ